MSFVAAATSVGAWALGTGAAAGIGSTIVGGALIGAGVGGAYSALTGDGKILDSMLTGAGVGGLAGGVGGAMFPGAAGIATPITVGTGATATEIAASSNINPATGLSWESTGSGLAGGAGAPQTDPNWWTALSGKEKLGYGLGATTLLGLMGGKPEGVNAPSDKGMIRPFEYSVAKRETEGGKPYYFEPIEYDKYGNTTKPLDTSERNYFTQNYKELTPYKAAMGGQVPRFDQMAPGGLAAIQGMRDGYGATQTMDGNIPQFADGGFTYDPTTQKYIESVAKQKENQAVDENDWARALLNISQKPGNGLFGRIANSVTKPELSSNQSGGYTYDPILQRYIGLANGGMTDGHLGGYSDGGQLLKGPGDGVSDSIPASINEKQPARLADGEFVIPARIVSELGNGSTDAGAKRLYEMMDRIQNSRKKTIGKGKVAVDSKAKKHLPA